MIVLDTNVISELMRNNPQQAVLTWLDAQSVNSLFVTTITEAEILTGIALLPDGRRRRGLVEASQRVFAMLFAERVLRLIAMQRLLTPKSLSNDTHPADLSVKPIVKSLQSPIPAKQPSPLGMLRILKEWRLKLSIHG